MGHKVQYQGDEKFCHVCGKRWSIGDIAPFCKTNLIGIAGQARSGKSTLAQQFVNRGYTKMSFAAPLKRMMMAIGCDDRMISGDLKEVPCDMFGGQSPRRAMQALGTEWGRTFFGADFWVNLLRDKIPRDLDVVIDDVRFDNEAEMIQSLGGRVIMLNGRGGIPGSHASEKSLTRFDFVYTNNSTPEDLYQRVIRTL